MDNITVIVEDYPQEITVQVVTTGITVDQANQIVANTQKVSDINHVTLELFNVDNTSDLDKPVSTATNQALNTEEQARIDADDLLQTNIDDLDIRVALNDVKVGISVQQANEIIANNAKVGITPQQITDITNNNAKVGITSTQADAIIDNSTKAGITTEQANSIVTNTAKVGITVQQASDIVTNNSKVGITTQQANDINTNNAKVGYTDVLVSANSNVVANTAKVGITTQQASDITTNNAKVSDINHVTLDLPNVDNTSDLNKPISIATQSALDLKVDKTQDEINRQNIFKAVSFAMDFSDRVIADSGILESRECIMNEYLKINI